MGLVHTIKTLADVCQGFLRNTDSRIADFKSKVLVIRIQYHLYPAMILVVFDGIFYQIRHDQRHLNLINFRYYGANALKYDFHIFFPGDRTQSFQDQFCQIIDIQ